MKCFIQTLFLLVLLALLEVTSAFAGINQWTSNGPHGGDVRAIAIDPVYPTTLYAGFNNGGIFKSTNSGESWSAINHGLTDTTVKIYGISSIIIDPNTTTTLYAGTSNEGVFKSTNGGSNWHQVNNGLTDLYINTIAIDPTNAKTLYAATSGVVFKSINGGDAWSAINTGLSNVFVNTILIDPNTPNTLYLGTYSGVFKSSNGGDSWTAVNTDLANWNVKPFAIDTANSNILYAQAGDGLFKSTNGGGSWSAINTGLATCSSHVYATSLVLSPTNSNTLFTETNCGLFKSTDGGASWSQLYTDNKVNLLAIDPITPATLYKGSYGAGIYKSIDSGNSWSLKGTGLTGSLITSLVSAPGTPTTLYAGSTNYAGAFKSTNGGDSWISINTGLTDGSVLSLAVNPISPTILYAGTVNAVFKSTNGGSSWSQMSGSVMTNRAVRSLAMDLTSPNIIYAGTDYGVYKSINNGDSWNNLSTGLSDVNIRALIVDPANSSIIYAGTNKGVFKSTNGGDNWSQVYTGMKDPNTYLYVPSLAIDPIATSTIYAGTEHGVFKSTNGGDNWNLVSNNVGMSAIVIDPTNRNSLFASADHEMYISENGGENWRLLTTNRINGLAISALAINPASPTIIFAGTLGGGVSSMTVTNSLTTFATPPGGSYSSAQNVSLSANKPATIYYTTDGSDPKTSPTRQIYSGVISIATNATLKFYGVDSDGSIEATNAGIYVVDLVSPITTSSPSGETYTSSQGISLACNDGIGSGCAATYYCLGTGCTPTNLYSATITISSTTDLRFYSRDIAGNRETIKTTTYLLPVVSGACGSSNSQSLIAEPSTNLCTAGATSSVSGIGPWSWTCVGYNGGSTASCSASLLVLPPVNGTCGVSNHRSFAAIPATGLCSSGTASSVSGNGPWIWTCAGSNGGTTATCAATTIKGDITGDGKVDVADALKVLRIAVGLEIATTDNFATADVAPLKDGKPSADSVIDISDALVILEKAVGLVNW